MVSPLSELARFARTERSCKSATYGGSEDWLVKHYKLKKKTITKPIPPTPNNTNKDGYFRVVVGSYRDKANAEKHQEAFKAKVFESFLTYSMKINYWP